MMTGQTPDPAWHHLRRTELALMRSCDIVATVSEEEAIEVSRLVPGARTVVLPTVHDAPVHCPATISRADLGWSLSVGSCTIRTSTQ